MGLVCPLYSLAGPQNRTYFDLSDSFRETVRKVSETLPAEPNGSPRSGFSVHFALRIAAKSSLGPLLVPFSDSLRVAILGNWASGIRGSWKLKGQRA